MAGTRTSRPLGAISGRGGETAARVDEPCRILEIICPGGFEQFFADLATGALPPDAVGARYDLEFDFESVPRLCAEHGLVFPLER